MNNTKVFDAKLEDFDGPFFPDILTDFMEAQDSFEMHNNYAMNEIAKTVPGFVKGDVYQTTDGHYWYYGLEFKSDGGEMVLLLPEFGDLNEETNRMERVRSVAVHIKGTFDTESTLQQLITGVLARRQYLDQQEKERRQAEDDILGTDFLASLESLNN